MSSVIFGVDGILADLDRAIGHVERVVDHQPAQQRLADAGDQLDRLGAHHRRDRGAQDAQHAALGAGRHHARRRRLGVEVAVVEAEPVGGVLPEHRHLPLEAVDRTPHVRLARQYRGVVDQVAGGEVVGAVQDQVVLLEQVDRVVRLQPDLVQPHLDQRVDLPDGVTRALGLGPADVGLPMDDLALQVRFVDDVELDDPDGPNAGRGEVQQRRRSQPACADDQHAGVLQPLLTVQAQVGDDQVAAVARDLFARQLGRRLYQRRQRCRHRYSPRFEVGVAFHHSSYPDQRQSPSRASP